MNQQERLELLACGFYNKISVNKSKNKNLGEKAWLAILEASFKDSLADAMNTIKEKSQNGIQGRSKNLFALVHYIWQIHLFTKWTETKFTEIAVKAIKLAVDENFRSTNNVSLEEALTQVLDDEFFLVRRM